MHEIKVKIKLVNKLLRWEGGHFSMTGCFVNMAVLAAGISSGVSFTIYEEIPTKQSQ